MNHIEKAVNEQLRSVVLCPRHGIGEEQKKGRFAFAQGSSFRRSPETIIIDAIDQGLKYERALKRYDAQKQKRKRRRGPRILAL